VLQSAQCNRRSAIGAVQAPQHEHRRTSTAERAPQKRGSQVKGKRASAAVYGPGVAWAWRCRVTVRAEPTAASRARRRSALSAGAAEGRSARHCQAPHCQAPQRKSPQQIASSRSTLR